MKGFRGFEITSQDNFNQKLDYIHGNPGRRGLCGLPFVYRWSSAQFYELGLTLEDVSLAELPRVLEL